MAATTTAPMNFVSDDDTAITMDGPSTPAVEVTAMFHDQVQAVAHLSRPRSARKLGRVFAGIALAGALGAAASFIYAESIASADKRAMLRHLEGDPRASDPAARAPRPANSYEHLEVPFVVELGFALGLLATVAGASLYVSRRREERAPSEFRLGEGEGVSYNVGAADLGAASFPLVSPRGSAFALNFQPSWKGELTSGSLREPLALVAGRAVASAAAPGALAIPVAPGMRARIEIGRSTFHVAATAAPRKHVAPLLLGFDTRFAAYLAGATGVAIMGLALLRAIPPSSDVLSLDNLAKPHVVAELKLSAKNAPQPLPSDESGQGASQAKANGSPNQGEVGVAGSRTGKQATGHSHIAIRGPVAIGTQQAFETGRNIGIVGALRSLKGPAFASVSGSQTFSSGIDQYDSGTGLDDGPDGDKYSWANGTSTMGDGPGGGGVLPGTIGNGTEYNTIGDPSKTGGWDATDKTTGKPRARKSNRPVPPHFGEAEGVADYDREMIRREILKHRDSFSYCYEKQLQVDDTLEGTVDTRFIITGNGAVRGASAKGVSGAVSGLRGGRAPGHQLPDPLGWRHRERELPDLVPQGRPVVTGGSNARRPFSGRLRIFGLRATLATRVVI